MKKIIQYLMALMMGFIVTSCYYDEMPPDAVTPIPDTVSYSKDVQPLWDASCISCHKTGGTAPDLTSANSFSALTTNNKQLSLFLIYTGNELPEYKVIFDCCAVILKKLIKTVNASH